MGYFGKMKQMKNKIQIINILIWFILILTFRPLLFFISPWFEESYQNTGENCCYKNQNLAEKNLIDSLKTIGFKQVNIIKPKIGLGGPYGSNVFSLKFKLYTTMEKDSLSILNRKLACKLYKDIISNMFIYDMNYVYIGNKICRDKTIPCKEINHKFHKDSLELWCGFKVIRVSDKKFKRIQI